MQGFDFVLGSLATWRVAALLVREDGPYDVIARVRRAAVTTGVGRALDCFLCTSLWVAAPVALWLAGATGRGLVVWLAVGGAAALLERLSAPREPVVVDLSEAERLNEGNR